MPIAFISHHDCSLHDMGTGHPECPARLGAINDRLISSGLDLAVHQFDAPLASRAQLQRVHDPDYVAGIFTEAPDDGLLRLDADTVMMPKTLDAALRLPGTGVGSAAARSALDGARAISSAARDPAASLIDGRPYPLPSLGRAARGATGANGTDTTPPRTPGNSGWPSAS